jgi:hypothetical protein
VAVLVRGPPAFSRNWIVGTKTDRGLLKRRAGRIYDPVVALGAGLEQRHRRVGILREKAGHRGASGAAPTTKPKVSATRILPLSLTARLGFCGTSGKSPLAKGLAREISRFDRHKTPKRSLAALSKAHRRWYIPLAPRGLWPGLPSQEASGRIGASGVGQVRFAFSGEGAQRLSRGGAAR